jgi:hypothetical protein
MWKQGSGALCIALLATAVEAFVPSGIFPTRALGRLAAHLQGICHENKKHARSPRIDLLMYLHHIHALHEAFVHVLTGKIHIAMSASFL